MVMMQKFNLTIWVDETDFTAFYRLDLIQGLCKSFDDMCFPLQGKELIILNVC